MKHNVIVRRSSKHENNKNSLKSTPQAEIKEKITTAQTQQNNVKTVPSIIAHADVAKEEEGEGVPVKVPLSSSTVPVIVDSPRLPARPGKKKLPTSTTTQNQIQTTTKLQNVSSSLEFQQIPLTTAKSNKKSATTNRHNSPRRSSSSSNNKKLSKSSSPTPAPASLQQQQPQEENSPSQVIATSSISPVKNNNSHTQKTKIATTTDKNISARKEESQRRKSRQSSHSRSGKHSQDNDITIKTTEKRVGIRNTVTQKTEPVESSCSSEDSELLKRFKIHNLFKFQGFCQDYFLT